MAPRGSTRRSARSRTGGMVVGLWTGAALAERYEMALRTQEQLVAWLRRTEDPETAAVREAGPLRKARARWRAARAG